MAEVQRTSPTASVFQVQVFLPEVKSLVVFAQHRLDPSLEGGEA